MKKSEMVELINGFFRAHATWISASVHNENSRKQFSEILLKTIVEAGMKPPLTKNCPVLLKTEHVWEPENNER